MPCYVGLDASKRTTSICVMDQGGVIVKEGAVATEPKAIVGFLRGDGYRYARVGMEVWSVAPWLYAGLSRAGLPIICIEAWHAGRVLGAARKNKTDKNDARGIAEIMRAGIYKAVTIKTVTSQRIKALLTVRKMLKTKATDMENAIGSALLTFGLKLNHGAATTFDRRVRALVGSNAFLSGLIEPVLLVRRHTLEAMAKFEERLHQLANEDPVCRRLMTAPGVGYLVALTYRAAVDEPGRFHASRDVAAHLGLTPRMHESGETRRQGGITRSGDAAARSALYIAALYQLRSHGKPSWLRTWGQQVAARRGRKKAAVAIARRLAVTLHRMWTTQSNFRWSEDAA